MVMELMPSTPCRLTMERADDGDGEGIGLDLKLCLGVGVPGPLKTPNTSVSEEDRTALESRMRCSRARDRVAREHEVLSGERRKPRARCPSVAPNSSPSPKPHPNSFLQQCSVPMMSTYPCHQVQYVPVDNEFRFPCVMPCWAPTVSAAAGGLNRACSGFPGQSLVAKAGNTEIKADSTGSTSSAISNQPSISVRGGSTCSGDSFINTHPKAQKTTSKAESCLMENTSSSACPRALERVHSVTKPCRDQGSEKPSPLPRMPLVSTTGNGPNGRTINGFLYRYTKSEVKILCVCHGSSFTPAEFVGHAGGTNVAQPMKEIVVVTVAGERNCSVYA